MTELVKHPVWKHALEQLLNEGLTPGDVIRKDKLFALFDISVAKTPEEYEANQFKFVSNFKRLEKELLHEHFIGLRNVRGIGYEVLHPKDQTGYGMDHGFKEIAKAIKAMTQMVSFVDYAKLSAEDRRRNTDALTKIANFKAMQKRIDKLDDDD